MTTIAGGLRGTVTTLPLSGVGDVTGVDGTGSTIDTTSIDDVGQLFPTATTITGISAYLSLTQAQSLVGTTVTIQAQLYISTTPDNTFTPVPGAVVTLAPALTGALAIGTISTGQVTGLSIPIIAGTRGMIVVSATAAGVALINIISGHASVSLSAST